MKNQHHVYQERFSCVLGRDVQVIQVIRTELKMIGEGKEGDPFRKMEQYWSLEGELLWERDHWKESQNKKERR